MSPEDADRAADDEQPSRVEAVDLDALTMTWSVKGAGPQAPLGAAFERDLLGQAAAGARLPGPLARLPEVPTRVSIDPRR